MKQTWHLYWPGYNVERGTATPRNPRPGYRWHVAYVRAFPGGSLSCAQTRREWQETARKEGAKAVFHGTEDSARMAVEYQR